MSRFRPRLTYANVIASIALFAALGGGAYAAQKVRTKDLANNAVKTKKLANGAVKPKKIAGGAVRARHVQGLNWRDLPLQNQWRPFGPATRPQFARDAQGIVHLRGHARGSGGTELAIGTLPPGFRPSAQVVTSSVCIGGTISRAPAAVRITPDGVVHNDETAIREPEEGFWTCTHPNEPVVLGVSLDSITFPAG